MDSIRVKNFRSFQDSGFIDLKPLTIFVGLNSSGKSSFLRVLPLIRQSLEKKTSGPILWYGDFVDFGSFKESVNNFSENKSIQFSFKMPLKFAPDRVRFSRDMVWFSKGLNSTIKQYPSQISVTVKEDGDGNSYLSEFVIQTEFVKISLKTEVFKIKEVLLNDEPFDIGLDAISVMALNRFIPIISWQTESKKENSWRVSFGDSNKPDVITEEIFRIMKPFFYKNSQKRNNIQDIRHMPFGQPEEVFPKIIDEFKVTQALLNIDEKDKKKLVGLLFLMHLDELLVSLSNDFENFFRSIKYVAPLRATAERYYRQQDLEVDEVDHKGKNISMVLRSFSTEQTNAFEHWTMENFGFSVRAVKTGGQYEVKVKKEGGSYYNIMDMGFGYSQIVPIITSLWMEVFSSKKKGKIIFVIEQPELHLHPGFQALMGNVFCKSVAIAKKDDVDLRIIVETHSESIINKIGQNIAQKTFLKDDASIYLFEKVDEDRFTEVRCASYTTEGYLKDWPYGFFEAS